MVNGFELSEYWAAIFAQDAVAIRSFFLPSATVLWHNTNEQFTVEDFIRINCEYPDEWSGNIEYELHIGEWNEDVIICAVHVVSITSGRSFHCCSAIQLHSGLIAHIDEYWGDDGEPPEWRQALNIGRKIVPRS